MGTSRQHANTVDLGAIDQLTEIVLRGGDLSTNQARRILQKAYDEDDDYDNVYGISVLFKIGASVADLAQEGGGFKHSKLGISVVQKIVEELDASGCQLILFITPMMQFQLPDHHTLGVARTASSRPPYLMRLLML
jgi:hypothetical protein